MEEKRHRGRGTLLLVLPLLLVFSQVQHTEVTAPADSESKQSRVSLSATAVENPAPVVQLRIYTINRGKLDAFVSAWEQGVYPLRREHGYDIPAAWTIEETNQFVWIVRYDGPEDWEEKEAAYYVSPERRSMDPDPAQWIARAEKWFVTSVLGSG